jgi:hypothetical protein
MIWENQSDGVWDCGFYRARRVVQGWELWWNHPQNLHLLAKARFLLEIKRDAEAHRKSHPV